MDFENVPLPFQVLELGPRREGESNGKMQLLVRITYYESGEIHRVSEFGGLFGKTERRQDEICLLNVGRRKNYGYILQ